MRRRDFIFKGVLTAGASFIPRRLLANRTDADARVVLVNGVAGMDRLSSKDLTGSLDRAISQLLQKPAAQAWKSLFNPADVVGLKVNALAGRGLSTHRELVEALCDRLNAIGIPSHQIIVFDRLDRDLLRAGYTLQKEKNATGCYGNDFSGYSDSLYEHESACSRISKVVTETCTAIINLPVLKDHGIVGISGALKNLFGLIDNPNKYHDQAGDPYVADVAMLRPIRDKVRLSICDGLVAQYEGGPPYMPQWTWPMNALVLATDMVAMDRVIWQVIEEKRQQKKLPSLREAGRAPAYINTAGDLQHALGQADLQKIKVISV